MLPQEADVNLKNDSDGDGSALTYVVRHQNITAEQRKEMCELLVAHGADVNVRRRNGNTPLHLAARGGQKDILELLIDKGADMNIINNAGRSPLRIAMNQGHTEIVELLRKHGAKE